MTKNKARLANRRISAKLATIKRAAGDEAEDVIDDVSDALDVEKDDVVEVVVDDPEGLVAELEVAGETELAGEVQEISLKVRQDDDVDVREEARRARRMAARRRAMAAARRNHSGSHSRTSGISEDVIKQWESFRWDPSDFSVYKMDDGGYFCSSDDGYATISIFKVNGKWAWSNHFEDDDIPCDESGFGFNSAQAAADSCFDEVYECLAPRLSDVAVSARRRAMAAARRNHHASTNADAMYARNRAARSRMARANIRRAYAWDLLDDFVKAMGVEDVEDGRERAKNTLDALADGTENVQTYVDHLREKGDDFCDQVADRLLSEFGKVDISADDDAPEPEPEVIDTDDADDGSDNGMPYDASDGEESREAARRRVDRSLAAARARAAKAGATTARKASNAKAAPAPARKASKARPSGVDAPVRVTRRAPVTATRRTASDDGAAYNLFY